MELIPIGGILCKSLARDGSNGTTNECTHSLDGVNIYGWKISMDGVQHIFYECKNIESLPRRLHKGPFIPSVYRYDQSKYRDRLLSKTTG